VALRLRRSSAHPVHHLQPTAAGGARELDIPTNHAEPDPTLLGWPASDTTTPSRNCGPGTLTPARWSGRDLADAIRAAQPAAPSEPVLFTTDDEISEGSAKGASPAPGIVRRLHMEKTVEQPNHIETVIAEMDVDGEQHLIKFSRYHDNQQFWTVPGERDERIRGRHTDTVTEPEPDEYELYDLTNDPIEERNLAHPSNADDRSAPSSRRCSRC